MPRSSSVGIGLWTQYVTGVFFILGVGHPGLAQRLRARPLVTAVLGGAVIGPLTTALDASADTINLPVRVISVWVVSLVVAWLCGNLYRSRERLLVEQARLRESEGFHRLIGELASDFAFHARIDPGGHIVIDSATSGLQRPARLHARRVAEPPGPGADSSRRSRRRCRPRWRAPAPAPTCTAKRGSSPRTATSCTSSTARIPSAARTAR